ncbi:hypothetical protein AB8Z38_30520 [Bradyrhizobium sp. LLZ17]|uniref:Uncharacterized protein n=1 Tax=Bradyrhizobium sp. LLZ17 TaxID=3239388 RepID=A0AB39XIM8_9BRAD
MSNAKAKSSASNSANPPATESSTHTLRKPVTYWAGVVTGVAIVVSALGYSAVSLGQFAWTHSSKISEAVGDAAKHALIESAHATAPSNLVPDTMYLTMFYKNKLPHTQTWALHAKGRDELSGEIAPLESSNKVLVHGYYRANTVAFLYASANPTRPGLGTFILRQKQTPTESDPPMFQGIAVVHECECSDGTATHAGPFVEVPAILTAKPTPPEDLAKILNEIETQELMPTPKAKT